MLTQRAAFQLSLPIAVLVLVDAEFCWTQAAVGLPEGFCMPAEFAFCAHGLSSPEHITMIADVRQDARFAAHGALFAETAIQFYASVSLTDPAGGFLGTLLVLDTRERTLDFKDQERLSFLAEILSSRIEFHRVAAILRDSTDHYRHCIQLNQQMPWTASARGRGEKMSLNRPYDEESADCPMTGNSWARTLDRKDVYATMRAWARSVRDGIDFDVECRRRLEDGGTRWFRSRAAPRRDDAGHILRWYGTVEDVHERKMAEISRDECEKQLRLALDGGGLGAWEADVVSHRIICSDRCVANFGLSNAHELSTYDDLVATIHPEDRDRCGVEVRRVFSTGLELNVEFRILWRDGSTHWNHVTGRVIYDDQRKPLRAVGLSADIAVRREAEEARAGAEANLVYLANHDALTGVANRRFLDRRIMEAIADTTAGSMTMLFCLDLDQFKTVNDLLGHDVGDRLLQHAAARLKQCVRQMDTVARYGGDEFAVVQSGIRDPDDAEHLARRILKSLSEPYELNGRVVVLGCSIGIALSMRDDIEGHQLLRNADTALYRAKASGRGTYKFFDTEIDARQQKRDALKLGLSGALSNNELMMFYQPLIDVQTKEVNGFEALMRWDHPNRGIVGPAEFIPVAEESGYIVRFGRFALHEACREAARWPTDITVAVNLSAVQFSLGNLEIDVADALVASGLAPERLELEITETLLMQASAHTATLEALRRMGVRLVMDDFGTGYSSLAYLRQFTFDDLKIDRSLITSLPDHDGGDSIVVAILALGSSLGISITAEGVETAAQLEFLGKVGCERAQGYLFSPPVPASGILDLLRPHWRPTPDAFEGEHPAGLVALQQDGSVAGARVGRANGSRP